MIEDNYDPQIEAGMSQIWDQVGLAVNKILIQANYGFQAMHMADPSVEVVASMLDSLVIPLLDRLVREGKLSDESMIKATNVKQYTLRLREMEIAIRSNDAVRFATAHEQLDKEAALL